MMRLCDCHLIGRVKKGWELNWGKNVMDSMMERLLIYIYIRLLSISIYLYYHLFFIFPLLFFFFLFCMWFKLCDNLDGWLKPEYAKYRSFYLSIFFFFFVKKKNQKERKFILFFAASWWKYTHKAIRTGKSLWFRFFSFHVGGWKMVRDFWGG